MTRNEIFENVESVFRDVLENKDIILKESYNSNDIDEWDFLNHIILVVEIEKKLNISFLSSEITEWENVGEMISCIESKKMI